MGRIGLIRVEILEEVGSIFCVETLSENKQRSVGQIIVGQWQRCSPLGHFLHSIPSLLCS